MCVFLSKKAISNHLIALLPVFTLCTVFIMTSLTFIWRIIRNSEGQITLIDDLENDQFYTKSASIVLYK